MKISLLSISILAAFISFGQKKDSTHFSNRETVFDFKQILLVYKGADELVRYQVEAQVAHKAAEYGVKCVPSVNLIPSGRNYATINIDSFKLVLKEKNIDAVVVIEVVVTDEFYKKKKGKKKKEAQTKKSVPNQNGDFQFASIPLNNNGKSLYSKKIKAIYVNIKFTTLDHLIVEEVIEIKKPKSTEDAINKLTEWVSKRLSESSKK